MKHLLQQYAKYNAWANETMVSVISSLDSEQQHQEITSSFSSLYKTLWHLWSTEYIWWQRMQQEKNIVRPEDKFHGSVVELSYALQKEDLRWKNFIEDVPSELLNEKLTYRSLKGDEFSEPLYLIIHHLFNHSTYHRGQLVTLMRQVGVEKIPSTDFVTWVRITIK